MKDTSFKPVLWLSPPRGGDFASQNQLKFRLKGSFRKGKAMVIIMRPLKEKVSITLDSDLIEKVRALAEADDRSFSQYINLLVKNHVIALEAAEEKESKE